jgi:FkbM family methyltransferase
MKPDPKFLRLAKRAWYRSVHASRGPHMVQARCCGVKFRFSSRSQIAEEIFANAFERVQRNLLDRLLTPGQTAIDIGANVGFYTCLLASRVGPRGRVVAFEPTPSTFELLRQNVELNAFESLVACRRQALSDRRGTALLQVYPEGEDVFNSLGPTTTFSSHGPVGTVEVPTIVLDEVLAEVSNDQGCFIKIDVEGFQHQVLLGGRRRLSEMTNVSLMVELHEVTSQQAGHSTRQTLELLDECGFAAYRMTAKGLQPFDRRIDMALLHGKHSHDVLFLKTPHAARGSAR